MTSIILNGKPETLEGRPTITELLQHLDLAEKRVAVELNREIVTRNRQSATRLSENDHVEIVSAVGGG